MTGGFTVFARGYGVDVEKTLKNWKVKPKTGKDLISYLKKRKLYSTGAVPPTGKSKPFLILMSPNSDDFEEAPIEDVVMFLANESTDYQYWVGGEWTKESMKSMTSIFDPKKLVDPSLKAMKVKWEFMDFVFSNDEPVVFTTQAEWPEYFVLTKPKSNQD